MAVAYKYFTQKAFDSNFDWSQVFPEKQSIAQTAQNVSFNIGEVALYLKDSTENFKKVESNYIDLDSAISEIVSRWYKSKNEPNPFVVGLKDDDEEFLGVTPREAVVVDGGKSKGKGAPKGAPVVTKAPSAAPSAEPKVTKTKGKPNPQLEKFKAKMAVIEDTIDILDDEIKEELLQEMLDKLDIETELLNDEDTDESLKEILPQRIEIINGIIEKLNTN